MIFISCFLTFYCSGQSLYSLFKIHNFLNYSCILCVSELKEYKHTLMGTWHGKGEMLGPHENLKIWGSLSHSLDLPLVEHFLHMH